MEGRWKHDKFEAVTHDARTQGPQVPKPSESCEQEGPWRLDMFGSDTRPLSQPVELAHAQTKTMRAATALPLLYLSRGQMQTIMTMQEIWCSLKFPGNAEAAPNFSIKGTLVIYQGRLHAVWGLKNYQGVLAVKLLWPGMSPAGGRKAGGAVPAGLHLTCPRRGQLECVSVEDLCDTPYDQLTSSEISSLCEAYDWATARGIMPAISAKQVATVRFWLLRLNQIVPHMDMALQDEKCTTKAKHCGTWERAVKAITTAVCKPQTPEEGQYLEELIRVCLEFDQRATIRDPRHCQPGGEILGTPGMGGAGSGRTHNRQRNRGASDSRTRGSSSSKESGEIAVSSNTNSSSNDSRIQNRDKACEGWRGEVGRGHSPVPTFTGRDRSRSVDREAVSSRGRSRSRSRSRSCSRARARAGRDRDHGGRRIGRKQLAGNQLLSVYEQRLFEHVVKAGPKGLSLRSIAAACPIPNQMLGAMSPSRWFKSRPGLFDWLSNSPDGRPMVSASTTVSPGGIHSAADDSATKAYELRVCWYLNLHGPRTLSQLKWECPLPTAVIPSYGILAFFSNRPAMFELERPEMRIHARSGWRAAMGLPSCD